MIERELGTFLQDGVGIHIGTRNERLEPNGARAVAVHVEDDGGHLTVYVAKVGARRILPDLEATGQAALVFGRPTDERACQVKGTFVSVRPARPQERAFMSAQWQGFLEKLERIGIPRASAAGWTTWPAVAIRLRATAIFEQTPGPSAGTPIA
jgi:hypothetical protein